MLCAHHHNQADTSSAIRRMLELMALEQFRLRVDGVDWDSMSDWEPIQIMRTVVAQFEREGRVPDGYSGSD